MNTGIKINVDGIELTVPTLDDAAELVRKIRGQNSAASIAPEPKTPSRHDTISLRELPPLSSDEREALDAAHIFLGGIDNAGTVGMDSDAMQKLLRVDSGKGIGGRTVKINNAITKLGFNPKQVYRNPRLPDGRIWKRGPKLQEALEAIKRRTG